MPSAKKVSSKDVLGSLNDAQRKAVETIEGPVMVVAGPGTGKTQVLAVRVANILRRTQMRPSNILCLTFSVSGATAMRERLRDLIGSDAYGVTINTIHGFCADLIESYPNVFDEWNALTHISDIERYREVNQIIEKLLPDLAIVHPQRPHLRTKEILDRISQVKREGKNIVDLRRVAEKYESLMAEKSKSGTKAHEQNLLAVRKYREFVEIFARYQEMLSETRRYDYDDMLLTVSAALQKHDWLLQGLQERYQYLLVDEFQDTNGAQYRLLEILTTSTLVQHEPNFFVVGDDDQAIYRFQGANLTNILSFRERFPTCPVIVLDISYRSTQSILDAAGRLISHNTERLVGRIPGLQKNLRADISEHGDDPRMLRAPSDMAEPWLIADLIQDHLAKGVPPAEIAVLTQTNSELPVYYEVLRARKIPVQMKGKVDLLSHPLVMQAVAVLRAASHPDDNTSFAAALACECFRCNPADLGRVFSYRRDKGESLLTIITNLETLQGGELHLQDIVCLTKTRDLLLDLHYKLPTRTLLETVEHVLRDANLIPHLSDATGGEKVVGEMQIDPLDIAALQEFYDRVKMRAIEQPGYTFHDYLNDLEFYANPDYPGLRLTYDIPHLVSDGVQLQTAHQSKGKEYEVIILANFRDGHWDKRRNPPSLSLPEDILFGWEREQKQFEQHQDERRVAYVAMTRAKRTLLMICPRAVTSGEKMREVSPSAFFAEAGPLSEEDQALVSPETASLLLAPPPRMQKADLDSFLKERLSDYALSVSAINRFLRDPKEFLEVDLLQIPQSMQWARVYGSAVHWALRRWALGIQQFKPLSSEQFLQEFNAYLQEKEVLSDVERGRLAVLGQEALPRYYAQKLAGAKPVIHRVEFPIHTHLCDIPLKGFIDRIDLVAPESASATIIDFKTGAPKTENEIRDGDLFRQLQFYAVLLDEGYSILDPQAFVLEFIGERAQHPVTRSFQITSDEKAQMRQLISDVWAKIIALDFTPL